MRVGLTDLLIYGAVWILFGVKAMAWTIIVTILLAAAITAMDKK